MKDLAKIISKENISVATIEARELILNGEVNPLDAFIKFKAMETVLKNLISDEAIKDVVMSEAEKYGKSFDYQNAKVTIKEAGVKYDYSVCGDMFYNNLVDRIAMNNEIRKAREKMLQTGMNPETGETFQKPIKSSSTTIQITIK